MIALQHSSRAQALARWSLIQAVWPLAVVAGLAIAATFSDIPQTDASVLRLSLFAVAFACGIVVVAYSARLAFDALLFRVVASYDDEWKGGTAVDDILARMQLKPISEATRSLADRAAGTYRLAARQRLALICASAAIILSIAPI